MADNHSSSAEVPQNPLDGTGIIKEAIILAGGLGTRLRDAVPDLPKCMAPVNEHPFLFYVINYLRSQGIEKFIFSLGYRHEIIESWLKEKFSTLNYHCSIEKEPLGTGGAILTSCYKTEDTDVLVVNGDTLFKIELDKASNVHFTNRAECTLLLKPMENFDRYGVVELNPDNSISSFKEKKYYDTGLINGGAYLLNAERFMNEGLPVKFSFEKDYLEKLYTQKKIFGSIQDEYFIDIGIPDDYSRAKKELARQKLKLSEIDKTWTLFLDRDGVINHEKDEDYIRNPEEFEFYDGAREAISVLIKKAGRIIVVSNQRGIGKKLMTEKDLSGIHRKMIHGIEEAGGRIDNIYYCTSIDDKHPDRKPNPGMAFRAKKDYPEIDFSRSIMIGNKMSDMLFGRNAGIHTVFLATTHPETPFPHPGIDARFNSLIEFANAL